MFETYFIKIHAFWYSAQLTHCRFNRKNYTVMYLLIFLTTIRIHRKWIKTYLVFFLLHIYKYRIFSVTFEIFHKLHVMQKYEWHDYILCTQPNAEYHFWHKRIPCRANYTRYWLQEGNICLTNVKPRGACTTISRKI